MKLSYTVHSSHVKNIPTELTLEGGTKIVAPVSVLIVELVPVGQHAEAGTIKLAIQNADTATVELFTIGSKISNTFGVGE